METDEDSDIPPTERQAVLRCLEIDDPATRYDLLHFDEAGDPDLRWGDYPGLLRKATSRLYGAYVDDRLAARMWLIVTANSEGLGRRPQLRLHFLEVLPPYRHLGLGSFLVRFAQQKGLPITLDVVPGAEGFYRRMGFTPAEGTGRKRNIWGEQTFVWVPGLKGVEPRETVGATR